MGGTHPLFRPKRQVSAVCEDGALPSLRGALGSAVTGTAVGAAAAWPGARSKKGAFPCELLSAPLPFLPEVGRCVLSSRGAGLCSGFLGELLALKICCRAAGAWNPSWGINPHLGRPGGSCHPLCQAPGGRGADDPSKQSSDWGLDWLYPLHSVYFKPSMVAPSQPTCPAAHLH